MKMEIEYSIKKRAIVECNGFDDGIKALMQTDWSIGNTLIERKPTVLNKRIIDNELTKDFVEETFEDRIKKLTPETDKVLSAREWLELLKLKTTKFKEGHPEWSDEKCKVMAKETMPNMPSDGWM